jgi:SAM-dependent methyltransferase
MGVGPFYWLAHVAREQDKSMDDPSFDPTAFKARQGAQWREVAQGWRRRWTTFEQGAQPLSDRLMELAHIAPGQRVLDVATGIGEPAMTAARRVGPAGAVVAIDQAPQMLAVAHERMAAAGVENVEFVEGDAETMVLAPASFDAVVSRWGLLFFQDPVGALGRFRVSLRPAGRLALAIWGLPERVPLISLPFMALGGDQEHPPAPPPGPNPFALSEPQRLEQAVRDAGFAAVQSEQMTVTFEFSSIEELLGHLGDVSAPLRQLVPALSPERQIAFWEKLAEAARRFIDTHGAVHLPNECLLVAGQR